MIKFSARIWALLLLVACLGPTAGAAVKHADPVLSRYFVSASDATMRQIAARFSVIAPRNGGFDILVPVTRANELLALAPSARLEERDIAERFHKYGTWEEGYHDFDSVKSDLDAIVKAHPTLASLSTYGKSQNGNPLYVLKVSGDKATTAAKTEVMITAATHGNELITVEVLFGILHKLVDNYGTADGARLSAILDSHVIYFLPVVNPDGYVQQSRYANGVDPNRDYPYPDDVSHRSNAAIFNEIQFFSQHNIKGSIDFHAYGRLIMYPWAYTDALVPQADRQRFEKITASMAEVNGYTHGQISRILYVAEGSSADYYYWKNKTLGLGIEVADDFVPDASEIQANVNDNLESTWRFLEFVQ